MLGDSRVHKEGFTILVAYDTRIRIMIRQTIWEVLGLEAWFEVQLDGQLVQFL